MKSSKHADVIIYDDWEETKPKKQPNPNKDQEDAKKFFARAISLAEEQEKIAAIAKIATMAMSPAMNPAMIAMEMDILYFKLFQPHLKESYFLPKPSIEDKT